MALRVGCYGSGGTRGRPAPIASSTSAAASCSAAFFVEPLPTPSCSPSIVAAHTNLPVVRRPLHGQHRVLHLAPGARERLLELGLRVDVARARVLDALLERLDDRTG